MNFGYRISRGGNHLFAQLHAVLVASKTQHAAERPQCTLHCFNSNSGDKKKSKKVERCQRFREIFTNSAN